MITPSQRESWLRWGAVGGSLFLVGVMLRIHPLVAFLIPIALFVLAAYLSWSVTGPLLFTLVLFLRPSEMIHPAFSPLKLGKVTAIACLVFWFLRFFFLKERTMIRDILCRLMLGLTVVIVICSYKSTHPAHSQFFLNEVWMKLALLFFAIVNLTSRLSSFRVYVTGVIGLSVVLATMGVHKGLTAPAHLLVEGNRVGLGTLFGDPNDYAQMLLVTGFPYLFNCTFLAPKRWKRWICIGLLLTVLTGMGMARSRGGFLGFSAASLLVLQSRLSARAMVAAGGGVTLMGLAFVALANRATTHSSITQIDESAQGRLDAWAAGGRMFLRNPIFGVGYECYPWNYLSYVRNPVDWKPKAVHNSWIKVIAELGILGSIFFFPLIVISLFRAASIGRWARKQKLHTQGHWYLEAILRSMFPALVGWCVAGTFLSNSFTWFLYIQIAIIIAATSIREHWTHPSPNSPTFEFKSL